MSVSFRCERCGRALHVDVTGVSTITCPHCKSRIDVPVVLAGLPRPRVAPAGAGAGTEGDGREERPLAIEQATFGVMSRLMPWVVSAFLHVAVFLILAFVTVVLIIPPAQGPAQAANTELLGPEGGEIHPGDANQPLERGLPTAARTEGWADSDTEIPLPEAGQTQQRIDVLGRAGGQIGGGPAKFGFWRGDRWKFQSRLCGVEGGPAGSVRHVVYVVDRSGSMLDTMDQVKMEMIRSITKLHPEQTFHVIFFSSGRPIENPPRRLVYATVRQKRQVVKLLKTVQPSGATDVLPALRRAFQVLREAPNRSEGKVIYLLTDGEFSDNEIVAKAIRRMGSGGKVRINTILHHHRSRQAIEVLRRIADENGGKFRFVEPGPAGSAGGGSPPLSCLPVPALGPGRGKGVEPWL